MRGRGGRDQAVQGSTPTHRHLLTRVIITDYWANTNQVILQMKCIIRLLLSGGGKPIVEEVDKWRRHALCPWKGDTVSHGWNIQNIFSWHSFSIMEKYTKIIISKNQIFSLSSANNIYLFNPPHTSAGPSAGAGAGGWAVGRRAAATVQLI